MSDDFRPDRRRALRVLGGLVAGATGAGVLASLGCAKPAPPPAPTLTVPLAELPEGVRVVRRLGDRPVELLRAGGTVRARSLWCTHQGCAVRWVPESGRYQCLCHEGTFDADGQPLSGPPPRPLRDLPVRVGATEVVVESPPRA